MGSWDEVGGQEKAQGSWESSGGEWKALGSYNARSGERNDVVSWDKWGKEVTWEQVGLLKGESGGGELASRESPSLREAGWWDGSVGDRVTIYHDHGLWSQGCPRGLHREVGTRLELGGGWGVGELRGRAVQRGRGRDGAGRGRGLESCAQCVRRLQRRGKGGRGRGGRARAPSDAGGKW